MFLLSRRQACAALTGAAASAAYLAAAEIGARKIKVTGLFVLAAAAMAGVAVSFPSSRACAKAYTAHQRLDQWFNTGGTVGGDVTVNGAHTVSGRVSAGSMDTAGAILMNGNNISNVSEINTDGQPFGAHGAFYMNGNNIHMQGGTVIG